MYLLIDRTSQDINNSNVVFPSLNRNTTFELEVGHYVKHKDKFGNQITQRVTGIKDDGFETYEYACMEWHTKKYPFDSIVEIIHNGAVLDKSSCFPEDQLQADIHKEMILNADSSMNKKNIKIGDRIGYKTNPDSGEVINTYTVQTKNMGLVKMYIVLHNNGMKEHHSRLELF